MTYRLYITLLMLAISAPAGALEAGAPYTLQKFSEDDIDITIDGVLDEPVWQTLPPHDSMVVIEPDSLNEAPWRTDRRLFYTGKGLYLGVWVEQPVDSLIKRLSSRDQFISRDDVNFTLDPSGQGLYGYWFGVTLGDTLLDGTVLPERQFSNQWDGPWYGASAEHENGWSVEMFLPWSMMTMPESTSDTREMGYYISRMVAHRNERWAYPALPSTRPVFMSRLQKIRLEGIAPKQQFTFYPYGAATWDNEREGAEDSWKTGFDVFWRPSTNLQLTATVNPDFGNVESDNVVVNLSSFETFYPEKRPFFLEGNEIFDATPRARSNRGEPTTMVNTRRIGASPRRPGITGFELAAVEANQPTELMGAAKVTGQSGRIRYGFLGAFEDDTRLDGELNSAPFSVLQSGRDFGIGRVLYEDTANGGRRALGWMSTSVLHPDEDAFTHGVDFHYLTATGDFNTDGQILASDVDGVKGYGGFVDTTWTPRRGIRHEISFEYFDDRLDLNDFGFLRRNDTWGMKYAWSSNRAATGRFKRVFRRYMAVQDYNTDGRNVRSGYFSIHELQFSNNHFAVFELNYFPERWDDINSNGNGDYRINDRLSGGMFYETDQSKRLQFGFGTFAGQEDIAGTWRNHEVKATWRPNDRFSLGLSLHYQARDGWLIHHDGSDFTTFDAEVWQPKLESDFFLSARQQFRITLQWAGIKAFENARWQVPAGDGELLPDPADVDGARDFSISRLTFQARYRWEIAPLSDLFVVYTRGSDISSRPRQSFEDNFRDAINKPIVDYFVVKLRYRLGS